MGAVTDANGLYYMRARYYNPDIKRFVNADIVAGSITDGRTLNRYAYVNGNPISFVDPFGLSAEETEENDGWLHGVLDVVGFVPIIGVVADGINSALYLSEGEYTNAGISLACIVGGDTILKGAKYADEEIDVGFRLTDDILEAGVKSSDEIIEDGVKGVVKNASEEVVERAGKNVASEVVGDGAERAGKNVTRALVTEVVEESTERTSIKLINRTDFIVSPNGTAVHASQTEMIKSITDAGATRIGHTNQTSEIGEIFKMNTQYG